MGGEFNPEKSKVHKKMQAKIKIKGPGFSWV